MVWQKRQWNAIHAVFYFTRSGSVYADVLRNTRWLRFARPLHVQIVIPASTDSGWIPYKRSGKPRPGRDQEEERTATGSQNLAYPRRVRQGTPVRYSAPGSTSTTRALSWLLPVEQLQELKKCTNSHEQGRYSSHANNPCNRHTKLSCTSPVAAYLSPWCRRRRESGPNVACLYCPKRWFKSTFPGQEDRTSRWQCRTRSRRGRRRRVSHCL